MRALLESKDARKYLYFITGFISFSLGVFILFNGEERILYKLAFSIVTICGGIQVVATFLKDAWKSSAKLLKKSFTFCGFIIIGSIVLDHLVYGTYTVPLWGLIVSYLFVVIVLLIWIIQLIDFVKWKKVKSSSC
ncbi:hypothetical protein [Sutcliffiella cohnii]|uniref:hypothetical protein n=1 Tax=Sutcliffiella cohnii TaxID=33932 RepID=UPI002E2178DC|nr:hypothetical protein [Sutcliffiella cohnii]